MSDFNSAEFLGETFTESTSTEMVQVPPGTYPAVVKKLDARQGEKEGKTWRAVDITWEIDDATVKQATGMEHPTVRQGVFLDLTEAGQLDFGKGKNVTLGRIRAALGQNDPGKAWSFSQLLGGAATVTVVQEPGKGADAERLFARVKSVAAL